MMNLKNLKSWDCIDYTDNSDKSDEGEVEIITENNDDGDDGDEEEVEIISEIVAKFGPKRRFPCDYRNCSDHFSVKRDMVRHSRKHDDQFSHSNSYMCHHGVCGKISTRRYSGLKHLRMHYRRRNWDNFSVNVKEDMIKTVGLVALRFEGRIVLFDSVLLPSKVQGANGKGARFFGGRSHVLSIESMFKGIDDEVQYVVSMRRHTPVYDDFSK